MYQQQYQQTRDQRSLLCLGRAPLTLTLASQPITRRLVASGEYSNSPASASVPTAASAASVPTAAPVPVEYQRRPVAALEYCNGESGASIESGLSLLARRPLKRARRAAEVEAEGAEGAKGAEGAVEEDAEGTVEEDTVEDEAEMAQAPLVKRKRRKRRASCWGTKKRRTTASHSVAEDSVAEVAEDTTTVTVEEEDGGESQMAQALIVTMGHNGAEGTVDTAVTTYTVDTEDTAVDIDTVTTAEDTDVVMVDAEEDTEEDTEVTIETNDKGVVETYGKNATTLGSDDEQGGDKRKEGAAAVGAGGEDCANIACEREGAVSDKQMFPVQSPHTPKLLPSESRQRGVVTNQKPISTEGVGLLSNNGNDCSQHTGLLATTPHTGLVSSTPHMGYKNPDSGEVRHSTTDTATATVSVDTVFDSVTVDTVFDSVDSDDLSLLFDTLVQQKTLELRQRLKSIYEHSTSFCTPDFTQRAHSLLLDYKDFALKELQSTLHN